jgi:hypothetical protein
MALYSTPFSNTVRTISGSAFAFADDVVLLCDTSAGAVTLTLQEIPANNWNILWKLFVLDNSNNAGTNNITINAPSGQTINLGSSVVVNSNGGGYVFEIGGNGKYLGTPSSGGGGGGGGVSSVGATSPLSSSGGATPNITITQANGSTNGFLSSTDWSAFNSKGASIAVINGVGTTITTALTSLTFNTEYSLTNVAGAVSLALTKNFPDVSKSSLPVVSDANDLNYNTNFDVTTSVTPNKVNIAIHNSGWINLVGFEHQASVTTVERPQCRVMGNVMYFKGTAIIPLASDLAGTIYVPPSSSTLIYASDPHAFVFQGSSGLVKGCTIAGILNKSIEFNLGASVIPPSANFTVFGKMNTGWKFYNRGIETLPTRGTLLTTMGKIEMDGGILRLYPYNYEEITWTSDPAAIGNGRWNTAMVKSGQAGLDWTDVDNAISPTPSYTHSAGTGIGGYSSLTFAIRSASYNYGYDVISAEADYLGGFMIDLDGLMAFPT